GAARTGQREGADRRHRRACQSVGVVRLSPNQGGPLKAVNVKRVERPTHASTGRGGAEGACETSKKRPALAQRQVLPRLGVQQHGTRSLQLPEMAGMTEPVWVVVSRNDLAVNECTDRCR